MAGPAGRTTAASVTGRRGSQSGRRAHPGGSDTAAAASTPYGGQATAGSGGFSSRNRAASRACAVAASSGRYSAIRAASSASVRGGSGTPSAAPMRRTPGHPVTHPPAPTLPAAAAPPPEAAAHATRRYRRHGTGRTGLAPMTGSRNDGHLPPPSTQQSGLPIPAGWGGEGADRLRNSPFTENRTA